MGIIERAGCSRRRVLGRGIVWGIVALLAVLLFVGGASAEYFGTKNVTGCSFKGIADETSFDSPKWAECGSWIGADGAFSSGIERYLLGGYTVYGYGYIRLPSNLNLSKPFYVNLYYSYKGERYGSPSSVLTQFSVITSEPDWDNFTVDTKPTDTTMYGVSDKTVNFNTVPQWLNYTISFTNYGYGLVFKSLTDDVDYYQITDNYITGWYITPILINYSNNKTNDQSINLTVSPTDNVNFNATADEEITTWDWYKDSVSQSWNYDNLTSNFTEGEHTISIDGTNANGTTNTITWNINSQAPSPSFDPSGYVNDSLGNPLIGVNVTLSNVTASASNISNASGFWNLSGQLSDGLYNYSAQKTGYVTTTGNQTFTNGGTLLTNITLTALPTATISCPAAGWCYIASNYTSKTLLELDNLVSTDTIQGKYNSTSQKYESHRTGYSFNQNITVAQKEGYYYYFTSAQDVTTTPGSTPSIILKIGWNLVGNYGSSARTLSALKTSIGAAATQAKYYDKSLRAWVSTDSQSVPAMESFFVYVTSQTDWSE